ncbi:MAG: hypothetical protein AAF699_15375, partial [Pseudomonadota bacterium]
MSKIQPRIANSKRRFSPAIPHLILALALTPIGSDSLSAQSVSKKESDTDVTASATAQDTAEVKHAKPLLTLPFTERDENPESRLPFESIDSEPGPENAAKQRYSQNRILPLFRKRAVEKGIVLPWPYGISLVGLYFKEQIDLDKLTINLPQGGTVDPGVFSELIEPQDLDVYNVSARFDAWLFPFLNVYGLIGKTEVDLNLKFLNDNRSFDESRNS